MMSTVNKYGSTACGIANKQLEDAWGFEWHDLSPRKQSAVLRDYMDAAEAEDMTISQYKRNIDPAPLLSYAKCVVQNYN